MIKLEVVCSGKNGALKNGRVVHSLSFKSVTEPTAGYAIGAAIGTPNAPQRTLTDGTEMSYTYIVNNGITVETTETSEADKYSLGETYVLSISEKSKKKEIGR